METIPLLEAVKKLLPDSSKTTHRSMVEQKRVSVDGYRITDVRAQVASSAIVQIWKKNINLDLDVDLLYEDNDILVILKPAGLLSVEAGYETEATAHEVLKKVYRPGRIFVIHRLDREVSGIMMYARTEDALWKFKELLQKRLIKREYVAIVEGIVKEDEGVWKSYLTEDEEYVVHSSLEEGTGEYAETHFKVLKRAKGKTELLITLKTGRKNQIRVHSASFGYPIVGDKKYGAKTDPVNRLCLHSALLEFEHPNKLKKMKFEQPLPEEFLKLWNS
jgi:tRNA pseudouridine32 synthase/23S rRNA pseudouridine746 synthase/23S rRNA pseudouridine1911/1915/1917 synthase